MRIVIATIGSYGDVHPFVGLGKTLAARGHDVVLIASAYFAPLIGKAGLRFAPYDEPGDFERVARNPEIWHPRRGFELLIEHVAGATPRVYRAVMANHLPGETVAVASSLAFGARVAQDKFGIPTATVHLSPSLFRSVHDTALLPGIAMPSWLPKSVKRGIFALADWLVIDRGITPPLNRFRAELGLGPVKHIMAEWWHSPTRVIGMFPDWFAAPQPDWPAQAKLVGFPLYDETDINPLSEELRAFLDAGDPPLVFTPGSAMWHADEFFAAAADACRRLNRRGILLSRHRSHIPANLPPAVRHFDYAPFSQLLPRSAALIHHGGIGTSSQAMAAGIPQLVMPMGHDQYDNANRMHRLGVAEALAPRKFKGAAVGGALKKLIDSPETAAAVKRVALKFAGTDALLHAAELVEQLKNQMPVASC